jgi:hypothetical protein
MAPTTYEDDEFDDVDEEWAINEGDDESEVLICPNCKGTVFEDAQQCPHCGDWIIPAHAESSGKRWIWPLAVALVILAFLIMTFR